MILRRNEVSGRAKRCSVSPVSVLLALGAIIQCAVAASVWAADPQPSPLFKHSLETSVEKMDKTTAPVARIVNAAPSAKQPVAESSAQSVDRAELAAVQGGPTFDATPTCVGFQTCAGSITCAGYPTCDVTCLGQPTCVTFPTCPGSPTCDVTCAGTPTCVGFQTCAGSITWAGYPTCDATCLDQPTCVTFPTCNGAPTCLGLPTCGFTETCAGQATCGGTATCDAGITCFGQPNCPGPGVSCDSICGWVVEEGCLLLDCDVEGATVELWSSFPDGELLAATTTDSTGHFCLPVDDSTAYDVRACANNSPWIEELVRRFSWCTEVTEDVQCEDGQIIIDLSPLEFEPLPTWPYFTDYNSSDAMFVHDDIPYPIVPGDVIYATDPQGVICGITSVPADSFGAYLIHVLGDDPETIEDEGAVDGDTIVFWLNCVCPDTAPDTWSNFGSYQFDAIWDCERGPLCCELCEGWNMWSHNRVLPDYAREVVLSTIELNYDAVRSGLCDYGSISWFADRPVNDLEEVSPWYGYDIHMLQNDTVCIEGELIDPQTPIYLCEGWNYIPYWPEDMDNLGHALESLAGNYSHIFTMYCIYGVASWNELREPQNNDLVCMETCRGYWIRMKSEDTLIYPAEPEGCFPGAAKLASYFTSGRVQPSPMISDLYAPNSQLNAGDVISVYGSSDQLVGEACVVAGGAYLVHAYGDVPYTKVVEGAVHGEELRFEVNGVAASANRDVRWYDRDNAQLELTVDAASAVPTEFALLQNYPNPFNAGTVMPFVMKNASEWTLTVYNIMGQTVRTFAGTDAAGAVRVSWNGQDENGSSVPSGVYFYRVTTPERSATRKMTLLK